jgi:hypothetical protein
VDAGSPPAPSKKRGGWNYRVMRTAEPDGKSGVYQIHEAYYENGEVNGWTGPVTVLADTSIDLLTVLAMMTEALEHPVLDAETGKPIEPAQELSDDLRRVMAFGNRDLFEVDDAELKAGAFARPSLAKPRPDGALAAHTPSSATQRRPNDPS